MARLFAALALLLLLGPFAAADTIQVDNPSPRICQASPEARYTLREGVLTPLQGEFSLYPPGEEPLEPRAAIPASAQPGDLVRIRVFSAEPLDAISVAVADAGGKEVSSGPGFRAREDERGQWWDLLLGIPPDAPAQEGTATLRVTAGDRTCMFLQPFTIAGRTFFSESIPLNGPLTTLMASPDPKKTAEYRALVRLLRNPHADATWESGPLAVPLPAARRTSGYGDRRQYLFVDKTTGLSIHQGVDLAAPTGTPVPASGRGRVVFAGQRILTGGTVIIEHEPGLFSLYFHLSALHAAVGDVVEKGQVIGEVGMTGLATGPHLHWEVAAGTVAVDPDALTAGPLLDKETDF
jgi:hypothetical protein